MENEKKEILEENVPVTDEEIKEVSGGTLIDTTLKLNEENVLPPSHQKFG